MVATQSQQPRRIVVVDPVVPTTQVNIAVLVEMRMRAKRVREAHSALSFVADFAFVFLTLPTRVRVGGEV